MNVEVMRQCLATAKDAEGKLFAWNAQTTTDTPPRIIESAAKHYFTKHYSANVDFQLETYLAEIDIDTGVEIKRVEQENN